MFLGVNVKGFLNSFNANNRARILAMKYIFKRFAVNSQHHQYDSYSNRIYFNNIPFPVSWHKDLFNTEVNLMAEEAEELAEFKVSNAMQQAFNHKPDHSSFWLSVHDSYPVLSKKPSVIFV